MTSENNFSGHPYLPMWPTKPFQPLRPVHPGHQPVRPVNQPIQPVQPVTSLAQPRPPPPPYPGGSTSSTNQLISGHQRKLIKNGQNWPDLDKQLSECLEQIKDLQDKNKQLKIDNQELRDLCCFLDDDRQRARKLAKEWQKFGRYTAKVMRQEVRFFMNNLSN